MTVSSSVSRRKKKRLSLNKGVFLFSRTGQLRLCLSVLLRARRLPEDRLVVSL
jgi:hypothetical protein